MPDSNPFDEQAMNLPVTFTTRQTERLVMRLMTHDDVDAVHAYLSREDVCRYLPFEPRGREEVTARVDEWSAGAVLAAAGDYWRIASSLDGQVIGDTFFALTNVEDKTGEIGWTQHPSFDGHGYASEAAVAMLGVAFEEIGLHRVVAQLDARNTASVAVCERLGMRREALFRESFRLGQGWGNLASYAILRSEFTRGCG